MPEEQKTDLEISFVYKTEKFKQLWKDKKKPDDEIFGANTKTIFDPFRCFALENFISVPNSDQTFEKLRKECLKLKFYRKNNDLYSFKQSNDLLKIVDDLSENLKKIVNFLKTDVKTWLESLLDTNLSDHVTMTLSRYDHTDVLLCHDDELENRRIAYVFYLSEQWLEKFGGRLDLFSIDGDNKPVKISESIIPGENMFVFFEVLPNSFHQVSEVTEPGQRRLSINGWFHGDPQKRPDPLPEPAKLYITPGFIEYDDVISWINPDYLNSESQAQIRQSFEDDSEIELRNFLQMEKYDLIEQELKSVELKWTNKTPFNKRNYFVLDNMDENLTPNLHKCYRLMTSETFYLLLSQLTGLKLHTLYNEDNTNDNNDDSQSANGSKGHVTSEPNEEEAGPSCSKKPKIDSSENDEIINPKCEIEIRKFKRGCYTLMHDSYVNNDKSFAKNDENSDFALDAQLFFTENDWKVKQGGYTCYVAKGEDEELLTIVPKRNSLALVYRGNDAMRFVKYLNCRANSSEFVDLAAVYYER